MIDTCDWGECQAPRDMDLAVHLCTRHALRVYRAVAEHIAAVPAEVATSLAAADPNRVLNRSPRTREARRNVKDTLGTIYFVRIGQCIKIGYTTNVRQRMAKLRPDAILATTPGTMRDEQALHHEFGEYWTNGEYFRPGPRLLAHIDGVRRGDLHTTDT